MAWCVNSNVAKLTDTRHLLLPKSTKRLKEEPNAEIVAERTTKQPQLKHQKWRIAKTKNQDDKMIQERLQQ